MLPSRHTSDRNRKGAVLLLVALLLILLVALAACAVDIGATCLADTQLQNAADSAAAAGVLELRCNCSAKGDAARTAAIQYAARNLVFGESVVIQPGDVELGTWDDTKGTFQALTGSAEDSANAVRVTCQRTAARGNPVKLFFSPALGRSSFDLTTHATARIKSSRCGLIIGLNFVTMSGSSFTDSFDSSAGAYSASSAGQNGHVCTNGDITMSGSAAIHGDAHQGKGKSVKSSSSIGVTGQITPLADPISYPAVDPGTAPTNNNNANIPKSYGNKAPLGSKGDFVLSGGDGVDLPPGVYYFNTLVLSGGSTIKISGPTTIYVVGKVDLSGGSVANMTLQPKNLQLYPMGTTAVISGGSDLYAVIYGPSAAITRSSTASFFGSIVGASLTMSGSGGIHADESLDLAILGSGVKGLALVE